MLTPADLTCLRIEARRFQPHPFQHFGAGTCQHRKESQNYRCKFSATEHGADERGLENDFYEILLRKQARVKSQLPSK